VTFGRRAMLAGALLLSCLGTIAARPFPWLGVRIRDLSEQEMEDVAKRHGIREGFGVVLVDIVEGTPAETAGLKKGDIVVAVNGRPIVETRLLQRLLSSQALDRDVKLTVLRSEGRRDVSVRLAVMPPAMAGERTAAELGFVLRETDSPAARGAPPGDGSPAIVAVIKDTPAAKAGLVVGDVILEVNGRGVLGGVAAREALADSEPARPVRLTVRRGDEERSITLEP
jgi:S1-C subfamily serine protease